jgi:hypothetical protein
MAIKMTKEEVAETIEAFLSGTGGQWDWDDFISVRQKNDYLENIRSICANLPLEYPPDKKGHYANDEGLKILKEMIKELRDEKG